MEVPDAVSRRRVMGSVVALGVSALASPMVLSNTNAQPPNIPPAEDSQRWEQIDSRESVAFERSFGPATVTATQQTVMHENVALRTELREKTLGNFGARISIAFATRVDIDPPIDELPANIGRKEVMDVIGTQGERGFRSQLQQQGITDVTKSGTTPFETSNSGVVTAKKYTGSYAFEAIEFPVADDASIEIPGDELAVDGFLATWHDGVTPLIAGAVYPGENFVETVRESLTDGIDVRLDIDLGLTPGQYRENVLELIGAVQ